MTARIKKKQRLSVLKIGSTKSDFEYAFGSVGK